ncbi:MAG: hypothetical protein KDC90_17215, partial [Ignavibacteriae bacterium]|nr:hypothetical protein [Ignavibacteriota bacterium]
MGKILTVFSFIFCFATIIVAQSPLEFKDGDGNDLMIINDEGTTGSVLTDKIGIGTSNPLSPLSVGSDGNSNYTIYGWNTIANGVGVYGRATNSGFSLGGLFVSASDDGVGVLAASIGNGNGLYGKAEGNGHGIFAQAWGSGEGVLSINEGTGNGLSGIAKNDGIGVFAKAEGNGEGVHTESYGSQVAIHAKAFDTGNNNNHGGYFESLGSKANGIFAKANGNDGSGIYATASGDNGNGVVGRATGSNGTGVRGISEATSQYQAGVDGFSSAPDGFGVSGSASDDNGVGVKGYTAGVDAWSIFGDAFGTNARAVVGIAHGDNSKGIYGEAPIGVNAYAGYFNGNVHVTGNITYDGTFTQASSNIIMDNPLDPNNKQIIHSGVSSSEMKNIYDGRVATNSDGEAIVKLPDWFEALNIDFRYQLTVIGEFAQAIVSEELNYNQFVIRTNKPNVKVSWQITGIRNDEYAISNKLEVERTKQNFESEFTSSEV